MKHKRAWAMIPAALVFGGISATAANAEDDLEQVDQAELNAMVREAGPRQAFRHAFEAGDELSEFVFSARHGVGANVGEGRRFTRTPRADLSNEHEWSQHLPRREGGPNATSCISCHNFPIANGAGDISVNVLVDPGHTGDPHKFLERSTLPLMALGVPQRIAEEMSTEIVAQRDAMVLKTCALGMAQTGLSAKGIGFGTLSAVRTAQKPCKVEIDSARLEGVDQDLIIKPFGWKGQQPTIRAFTRGAAHNELGLQGVEMIGHADGDHDGVINELSVGDITALTLYMAGLERPVTQRELAEVGIIELSESESAEIARGETLFSATGCAACHTPEMKLDSATFQEPSPTPGYHDLVLPSGTKPADEALTLATPMSIDLTVDQPNNRIRLASGVTAHLGSIESNGVGGAVTRWFSDFKRHDMGENLADPDDPLGIGARMWLTRSLAGVGSTGPWLHDGRATTLDDAIRMHGGEAAAITQSYAELVDADRSALLRFLDSLVIYKHKDSP
jgi:cytochrome c553